VTDARPERDPAAVAIELVRALRAANVRCAVGGSIALGLWGVPRGTNDADLNAFVPEERHGELLDVLVAAGCLAPEDRPWTPALRVEFLRRAREGETAVVWKDGFRVDVFVPSIPFYAEAEATLREVEVEGGPVPVLSPEALSVFKLLFFRDKDLVDLRRLVARQGARLDAAYVRAQLVAMVGEDDDRITAWDAIVREHRG
jgi:hypothetical protein